MKKFILFLILVGIGVGIYYWKYKEEKPQDTAKQSNTVPVEIGSIRLSISCTGRVVSNLDVDIKCKASGEVVYLPYDISDTVTKGIPILKLDPVDEERNVKQCQVALSGSKARLIQAKQNLLVAEKKLAIEKKKSEVALKAARAKASETQTKLERIQQLLKKKVESQESEDAAEVAAIQAASDLENAMIRPEELVTDEMALENKRQDVVLAQTEVDSDEINLSNAMQRFKDTTVVAPIDGVVSSRNVQIGQIISSGISNVGGGTTVLTISDLSHLFVLAAVDESDIGNVVPEQPAIITVDAFPGKRFRGKVVRIATKGENVSNVVTFQVKIEVFETKFRVFWKDKSLLPEMTANVEILIAERENVLLVPAEAIVRKHRDRFALILKEDGTTEEKKVEVGITDGVKIEIKSGLTEGQKLVVPKDSVESRWRGDSQRKGFGGPMMFGPGMRKGR